MKELELKSGMSFGHEPVRRVEQPHLSSSDANSRFCCVTKRNGGNGNMSDPGLESWRQSASRLGEKCGTEVLVNNGAVKSGWKEGLLRPFIE
ncbi:hypothetical protein RvY_14806 [Ramazzottius varieornatus]|uniref:Uncharacterized protein n=1 Tax=Ramazzottius varieornatus TaxID=947166 RepID=A0A1D1VXJ2_RAMVA|nr:hypothetical protein RvY_14806 [Ramazzottius varieornatus]